MISEITDIQDSVVLEMIANETGMIANLVLMLNECRDLITLGYAINILTNLAQLPEV
jgi:hypothetical protein